MNAPAILALGEAMIEFNQTRRGDANYLQGFGGDTSNAIIACARQGAPCGYITRIGNDTFGHMLKALWNTETVGTQGVEADDAAHTAVYFVTHDAHGHTFSYLRKGSAASLMTPDNLPRELIRNAKFLHVSGISQAISASATDTVAIAMRLKLWPLSRAREVITASMGLSDYLLPSLEDMLSISGLNDPDAILDWCFAQGARNVVLKLGAKGCIAATPTSRTCINGRQVSAVDATGAGDCFDGALLARLHFGDDLISAARYANAAAALTTTGFGAVAPLPRRDQVERFLQAQS
jgi:2-dehydro-3-deoxygluconokinase